MVVLSSLMVSLLGPSSASAQLLGPVTPVDPSAGARVVIVDNPRATQTFAPQPAIVREMMAKGLSTLWQTSDLRSAWRARIQPEDVVGIRIHSSTGKTSGSRPEVVAALIESLIAAGHSPSRIIVWDRQTISLRNGGYDALATRYGVQVRGARQVGYDGSTFYESSLIGTMIWGDHEFGQKGEGVGKRSFVSRLLTQQITKIINITPLLNHNYAGVSGNLHGLAMASVDNTLRFQSDRSRLAIAVPEILALPEVGDRVVLNIVDALIAQYQGQSQARLQDSAVLNELRFSHDPVALDVLSLSVLEQLRKNKGLRAGPVNRTLYENASLLQLGTSDLDAIQIERVR